MLSPCSNNGDVNQSNDATTIAKSSNSNTTNQSNAQDQHGSVQGGGPDRHGDRGDCGHPRHDCGHQRRDCGRPRRDRCRHRDRCDREREDGCDS